jgi:hypothetical protein
MLSLDDALFANLPAEPAAENPLRGIVVPGEEGMELAPAQVSRDAVDQVADHLQVLDMATITQLAMGDKETVAKLEGALRTAHRLDNQLFAQELRVELRRRVNRAPTDVVLAMYKTAAQEGALTPKDDKGQGSGFQLVINMGEPVPKPITIEQS